MRRSRIRIKLPASSYEERCAAREEPPQSIQHLKPWEYSEYECPECGEWVRVPLPAGANVTCTGCGTLLSIDVDAEFDENGWHDRTHLSVAREEVNE